MIQHTSPIPTDQESPAELKNCLWAVIIAATVIICTLAARLPIDDAEVVKAQSRQRLAEQRTTAVEAERDAALREHENREVILTMQLSKAESARRAAEQEARTATAKVAKLELSAARPDASGASQLVRRVEAGPSIHAAPLPDAGAGASHVGRTASPEASAQAIISFIEEHLVRMTGPLEAELPDYADEVDFHDKPRASLRAIEDDRRQWIQKFPVRQIFMTGQPRIEMSQNPTGGWLATATLDLRWQLRSRTGGSVRAVTRETWKIVQSPQGFKIIAEHSADPVTGHPKD